MRKLQLKFDVSFMSVFGAFMLVNDVCKVRFSVTLERSTVKALESLAADDCRKRNNYIEKTLKDHAARMMAAKETAGDELTA